MRVRLLMLVAAAALLFGGTRVDVSSGQGEAPARASARAALASGLPGRLGDLSVSGDRRRAARPDAEARGVRVARGEVAVRSSRNGGVAVAEASVVARSVSVFDGLVTAYGVRRSVRGRSGETTYSGAVDGLKIEGRMVGRIGAAQTYELDGGAGTVEVNRGGSGLRVTLAREVDGFPAGSRVTVAAVGVETRDGLAPGARPARTATPTPTATPRAGRTASRTRARTRAAPRRKAPKVPRRLTAQRFAFPVFGSRGPVADTWGADRQIGAHQGNDIFAPFGSPVLAVTDGEVFKVGTLPISGNRLWLRSRSGDEFFYAHLSAFSPAAVNGREVRAGDVLGFTGNTGDAEPTPPHVHFEIHPGGGDAIDPNEILEAWRTKRDVPPGAWLERYGGDTRPRPGALVEVRDFIAGE